MELKLLKAFKIQNHFLFSFNLSGRLRVQQRHELATDLPSHRPRTDRQIRHSRIALLRKRVTKFLRKLFATIVRKYDFKRRHGRYLRRRRV